MATENRQMKKQIAPAKSRLRVEATVNELDREKRCTS